jgi:hypothetical protein
MVGVPLLCQIPALGVVPCGVEVPRRNTMPLGDVLDLPSAPRDIGHVRAGYPMR